MWKFKIKNNLPIIRSNGISNKVNIPEPTKSLLFVTDDNPEKIENPFAISVMISLDGASKTNHHKKFYAEPSLIWTKLPVKENSELPKDPIYYPSYSTLSPENRYHYLNWLQDITSETNLSFVFLYYYGLERQLLIGDYEKAHKEIFRLMEHHPKGSFMWYAKTTLLSSAIYRNNFDFIIKHQNILNSLSTNESFFIRKKIGSDIYADDLINISTRIGFKNKRYIKMHPDKFKQILQEKIKEFESSNNQSILNILDFKSIKYERETLFANSSIPENVSSVPVAQIIEDPKFSEIAKELLIRTHNKIKKIKKEGKI